MHKSLLGRRTRKKPYRNGPARGRVSARGNGLVHHMRHDRLRTVLILAISGRALAQAARRAGYAPLVADFFCDRDAREAAARCVRVEGDIAEGFAGDAVMRALERLERDAPALPVSLVYGAGLEAQPDLIAEIAARWPVIGNGAATVSRVKDPRSFFGMLDSLGIDHPEIRFSSHSTGSAAIDRRLGPHANDAWLHKCIGGAGGSHIKPLDPWAEIPIHAYAQRCVDGRPVSALILSDASGTRVLGFSEQWRAPALDRPYRYGGAVQPAGIAPAEAERMTEIAASIGDAFGLRGLGSIDFIQTNDGPLVLEVNPRPGATLDIFDCDDGCPLLAKHVAALELKAGAPSVPSPLEGEGQGGGPVSIKYHSGIPPTPALPLKGGWSSNPVGAEREPQQPAKAAQIVFAPCDLTIPNNMSWPDWTADRPHDGETIVASRPVCTVRAEADTPAAARALAAQRESVILESIQSPHKA